jgi:prepilin-type N-terminal cleavage/methylation domain-containing protein
MKMQNKEKGKIGSYLLQYAGFTLVELLVVIVILSIAALIAIPMLSSAGEIQVSSAADMIAADLEYAKSMAVSRQKTYKVIFDSANESYRIEDGNGIIMHPVNIGKIYELNFKTDNRVNQVKINSVDFGGASQVEFNYLGSPSSGGTVALIAGGKTIVINVEAATGYVSVSE